MISFSIFVREFIIEFKKFNVYKIINLLFNGCFLQSIRFAKKYAY